MNEQEAIKKLGMYSSTNGSGQCTDKEHKEAKRIAIRALELQIPLDVVNQNGIPLSGYCPRCGAELTKPSSPVGCKWCLQRVKWKKDNENEA